MNGTNGVAIDSDNRIFVAEGLLLKSVPLTNELNLVVVFVNTDFALLQVHNTRVIRCDVSLLFRNCVSL